MKRKRCRKRTRRELKSIAGSQAPRDRLRRDWIAGRCRACGRCRKLPGQSRAASPPGPLLP